jgi:HlyD family secretion protein
MKRLLIFIGVLAIAGGTAAVILAKPDASISLDGATTHRVTRGTLQVTVTEQGTLESSSNTEIKCRVRGDNTIISVVESGTQVQAGDELVRLDTLGIEEEISERTKFAHLAESAAARSKADVEAARLAILEYEDGQFVSDLATLEKNRAITESNLRNARNRLSHTRMMARSEYKSELDVEERQFVVAQAQRSLSLIETQINVLKKFTKAQQLARLNGELKAAEALHEADVETAFADRERLKRAQEELEFCVIKAPRAGMVIYPSDKQWENAPEIEEGATVHKDQILLLMPDLSQMQVKVGIHESVVDRIREGMGASVTLPKRTLDGTVSYVAAVTRPAGWWTGNVVKYDTIVDLPRDMDGLKPGMSVEVEIILATHENVLLVPTSAVIETRSGHACWVKRGDRVERRSVTPGDSNDMFIAVESGVAESDEVILDPLAHIEAAQLEAASLLEETGDSTEGDG